MELVEITQPLRRGATRTCTSSVQPVYAPPNRESCTSEWPPWEVSPPTTESPHVARVGRSADERVGLARVWRASEERASGCPLPLVRAEPGGRTVVSTSSTTRRGLDKL